MILALRWYMSGYHISYLTARVCFTASSYLCSVPTGLLSLAFRPLSRACFMNNSIQAVVAIIIVLRCWMTVYG